MTQYGLKEKAFDANVKEIESKLSLQIEVINKEMELLEIKIKLLLLEKQILAQQGE